MQDVSYIQDASVDAPGDGMTYMRSHKHAHTVIVRRRFKCNGKSHR